jgi:hypothetical protein
MYKANQQEPPFLNQVMVLRYQAAYKPTSVQASMGLEKCKAESQDCLQEPLELFSLFIQVLKRFVSILLINCIFP